MSGAICIILARAGSKGAPGKNTALVGGKPCVSWSIAHALQSDTVDRVVLSADSDALLRIAQAQGAETVARPDDLASDTATVDAAARHAVDSLSDTRQTVVILYGNVPVRPGGGALIDRAVRLLRSTHADSVQSYAAVGKSHPWWTVRADPETGVVQPWEGRELNHGVYRRQDLPPAHVPDGGVLAVTRRALFLQIEGVPAGPHAFFGADQRAVLNDTGAVIDIDTPTDVLVADAALRTADRRSTGAPPRTVA